MIELRDDGFAMLQFTTAAGVVVEKEIDVMYTFGAVNDLSTPGISGFEFMAAVARYLESKFDGVKISNLVAQRFYRQLEREVAEIKKNDPYFQSADSPEPTASPSGPIPGEPWPPA